MIDVNGENVITLTEAAKRLPGRNGKRLHVSSVFRWAERGVHGIRLEVIKIGGATCTSEEALQRFAERLTAGRDGQHTPVCRTTKQRERASARADRELTEMGV